MTISKIEQNELPESYSVFTLYHARDPAHAIGQVVISASGHHPKCRLVRAVVISLIQVASDVIVIERQSGEDVASATASTTEMTPVVFTIAPAAGTKNVFERNEDICINLTTDGDATNSALVLMTFESID